MPPTHFDIAILGAGCAGFQLLHHLSQQPDWPQKQVALFRDNLPLRRSWCFWAKDEHPLQQLVKKSWQQVKFIGRGFSKTESIAPYSYHYIAGEDFFNHFQHQFLPQQHNITLIDATVKALTPRKDGFCIESAQQQWESDQVYSSIFAKPENTGRFWLQQHFKGWFVRSESPIFDDSSVTLMDFSIAQAQDTRFMYILPFSSREALVEMTVFSPETYAEEVYHRVLEAYIAQHFANARFHIYDVEHGAIPMTDTLFSRHGAAGEVLLGAAAGMVKASTGYAFKRIGADAAQLAADIQGGRRLRWAGTRGRFRFYDRLLLGILQESPATARPVFEALFKNMDIKTILRFLDEETHWSEELRLFSRLPFRPFLKQVYQQWIS